MSAIAILFGSVISKLSGKPINRLVRVVFLVPLGLTEAVADATHGFDQVCVFFAKFRA